MFKRVLIFCCLCVVFVGVIADAGNLRDLKIIRDGQTIARLQVEVSDTADTREKGLMFRKHLPEGRGMWFIFDKNVFHPFWMENTYISLDIIFVDDQNKIVTIVCDTKPLSRNPIYPKKAYRYVLEVPAGYAKKAGLRNSDVIILK